MIHEHQNPNFRLKLSRYLQFYGPQIQSLWIARAVCSLSFKLVRFGKNCLYSTTFICLGCCSTSSLRWSKPDSSRGKSKHQSTQRRRVSLSVCERESALDGCWLLTSDLNTIRYSLRLNTLRTVNKTGRLRKHSLAYNTSEAKIECKLQQRSGEQTPKW